LTARRELLESHAGVREKYGRPKWEYQRYNALTMLMSGMKNGELSMRLRSAAMAAVMIYQASDPYGRSCYNPLALRAMDD
jgi:hypothetical protein